MAKSWSRLGEPWVYDWATSAFRCQKRRRLLTPANLAVAALFFGQFLNNRAFSPGLALFGIGIWMFLIVCAYVLAGGNQS